MEKIQTRVIQPHDLFEMHNIKNQVDAEKVLSSAFNILVYLRVGDAMETSALRFTKVADDLLQIESILELEMLVDTLQQRRIIKLPI